MNWKHWVLLGGLILIFLAGAYCGHNGRKADDSPAPAKPPSMKLAPDEIQKIVFSKARNSLTIARRNNNVNDVSVREVVGVRHATVVVKKDGTVTVVAKPYGLCFEPGVGVAFGDGPGMSLDLQLMYWHDVGGIVGARIYPKPTLYIAGAYSLSRIRISNTSLFLAAGLGPQILGGVRVAF